MLKCTTETLAKAIEYCDHEFASGETLTIDMIGEALTTLSPVLERAERDQYLARGEALRKWFDEKPWRWRLLREAWKTWCGTMARPTVDDPFTEHPAPSGA